MSRFDGQVDPSIIDYHVGFRDVTFIYLYHLISFDLM